ncbi:MAG: phosphoesterase [Candidatus Solibacter usitatus]|nr:phosphoesterase [Candidatus Solibacter usitatus]
MKVRVLYHDHCFDGAASAAFFSRFSAEKFYDGADYHYTGMAHKASQLFEDGLFDGHENAIVDFKYSNSDRVTWWFDHHQSAFLCHDDQLDYESKKDARRFYFDPGYRSCTEFIAHIARSVYGYEAPELSDLVHWAGIIDGALYKSAAEAVAMAHPAMKLTLVIEAVKGSEMVQRIIRMMQRRPLEAIMADPEVQAAFQPLYERHLRSIDVIGHTGHCAGAVVYFDVADYDMEGYNKFVPYSLFPQATYTVSVSLSSFRTKVSVGSNPWAPREPTHNLATICERYGGGGHPRVGAISFERGQLEEARRVAREIAAGLRDE